MFRTSIIPKTSTVLFIGLNKLSFNDYDQNKMNKFCGNTLNMKEFKKEFPNYKPMKIIPSNNVYNFGINKYNSLNPFINLKLFLNRETPRDFKSFNDQSVINNQIATIECLSDIKIAHIELLDSYPITISDSGCETDKYSITKIESMTEYLDNLSEQELLRYLKNSGPNISHINYLPEKVQILLIKKYNKLFKYIDKPSEVVQLEAVKLCGSLILHITNPSEEVQLAAVKSKYLALNHTENILELIELGIQSMDSAIQFIENPSKEVQLEAVKFNYSSIRHIKNPSEEVQLAAVKSNYLAIQFIENPSEKVQLEAVKSSDSAIQFIKNPTEKVQLHVVKNF